MFFSNDRKGIDLNGSEGGKELGEVKGGRDCNQDMLYEKRIYFQ